MLDTDGVVSVRDLVLQKLNLDDRWNLALVQRAEVWDQVRMRHLLDSMLAGYPIGAILLCRVEGASKVIRVEGGQRRVDDGDPNAWQLLDGQQRINAFFSMLTGEGQYGRFYLHMTMRREGPGARLHRVACRGLRRAAG
ncbi:DUF262 domain-containing protein [Cryobacterium sp. N21]|uniref:DUF262 domain-containing protein n=1 Tax=Cryobacterium sp. N21 TaxID=2048289 RepID=UPI000CE3E142|nr:DUF262 domain-containing protein [Cryobacterium sp. N21]